MYFWTSIIVSFIPAILWVCYVVYKDRSNPEPKSLIIKAFFLGMLAIVFVSIVGVQFNHTIWYTILLAPIIEECIKYAIVKYSIYRNKTFDQVRDGIIYASIVWLWFASIENIVYLVNINNLWLFGTTAIVRALFTIPWHMLFASMRWYALWKAKFTKNRKDRSRILVRWLAMWILLHMIFNAWLLWWVAWWIAILISTIAWRIYRYRNFYSKKNDILESLFQ